jgi:hypothetical protein
MTQHQTGTPGNGQDLLIAGCLIGSALCGLFWLGGLTSAWVTGHRIPHGRPSGALAAFAHYGDPSAAWHPLGRRRADSAAP